MATKFPAIPDPKTPFETAVKEVLEILLALRGVKDSNGKFLDRTILYREFLSLLREDINVVNAMSSSLLTTIGFGPPTEKVISGDAITVTGSNYFRFHTVDTEDDAATDDLDTINGGRAGELLLIKPIHADRSIVIKNGASILSGTDFTMNNIADAMLLYGISSGVWYPLTKYNAGG